MPDAPALRPPPSSPRPPQVRNGLCGSLLMEPPADMAVEDVLALHGAVHLPKASHWGGGRGRLGWGAEAAAQEEGSGSGGSQRLQSCPRP